MPIQDATLARAEADLRRAETEIERATKERDEIAAYIRRHKKYAGTVTGEAKSSRDESGETLAEAIEAVMRASGKAMSVPEIVDALKLRGRKFGKTKAEANVSSTLSRKEQFHFERDMGGTLI